MEYSLNHRRYEYRRMPSAHLERFAQEVAKHYHKSVCHSETTRKMLPNYTYFTNLTWQFFKL